MASPGCAWNKHRKWCRLVILLLEGGENRVKHILCQMGVDITDGAQIYHEMKLHEKNRLKKIPSYLQKDLLPSSKIVDTSKLDLPAQCHIIEVLDMQTKFPLIKKLRNKRNELFHMSADEKDMTEQQFDSLWVEISQLLTDLGYDVNMLKDLKTGKYLSEEHKKRLDHIEGRLEQSFIFFSCFSK